MEFMIGDRIKWTIGRSSCRGIFREDFGEESEIVCYEINNQPTRKKIIVKTILLVKDED